MRPNTGTSLKMTEDDNQSQRPESSPGQAEGGSIFGNLPKERPGARSPRRAVAGAAKEGAKPKRSSGKRPAPPKPARPAAKSKPAAGPQPASPSSPPPRDRPDQVGQPMRREGSPAIGGIEDLAWAGVTVAAQAATVGVKLASRALEAVRKSVDRP